MSDLFSIFSAYWTMSEWTSMYSENDDQKMENEPSMGIVIWMVAGFSLWIVLLLLFIIL